MAACHPYADASAASFTVRFAGFGRLNQKLHTAKLPSIVIARPESVITIRQLQPPTFDAWIGNALLDACAPDGIASASRAPI